MREQHAVCSGCAGGIDRRTFLSAAAIAAVVATLDACSSLTGPGSFSGSYGGPFTVSVANFSTLATVGGVARVDGGSGAPVALYRSGTSTYVALSMVCPHAGYAPINITSTGFYCPGHGSTFTKNGSVTGGPSSSLVAFQATFDATAGTVRIARPS